MLTIPFHEDVVGRLPANIARVSNSFRDFSLIDLTLPKVPLTQRIAIVYDFDRDLRVLWVLSAFIHANRKLCAGLIGLAEAKGVLQSFWTPQPTSFLTTGYSPSFVTGYSPVKYTELLQAAADVALEGEDHWTVAPAKLLPVDHNGRLDASALSADHPLRLVPPRFLAQLGQVQL